MNKTLVYIDAENVTMEKLSSFISDLRCENHDSVIGKFYGSRNVLGSVVRVCYSAGFEYVDTSMLTGNKKNATDIKLAVDCITDVAFVYHGSIERVYVVSSDHDFVPLLYKIAGFGITAEAPFIEDAQASRNCTDVTRFLDSINFNPLVQGCIITPLYETVIRLASEHFDVELLTAFCDKRKSKVIRGIFDNFGQECAELASAIPVQEFGFTALHSALPDVDEHALFRVYTTKMFGIITKSKDTLKILEEAYDIECQ